MGHETPLTVLYDEGCAVCTRVAAWLAQHGAITVAGIGSLAGERALRDLTPAQRYAAFHAIDERGRRRSGGAAVPVVLRALRGGRVPAALAGAFPRLTTILYDAVAGRRSGLSRLF